MTLSHFFTDVPLCWTSVCLLVLWAVARWEFLPVKGAQAGMEALFRMACGFLLLYASLDKIGNAGSFSKLLGCYGTVPATILPISAVVVPWVEFFTGACLLLGVRWRGAALVYCVLLVFYTLTMVWVVWNQIDCTCPCFNIESPEKVTRWTVLRDLLLLGLGLVTLGSTSNLATGQRLWDRLRGR